MSSSPSTDLTIIAESGPLFIGVIFNYLFTGILVHQLFDYNKNYPNDKHAVKWLVYGVFLLDILQTGFTTQFAWFYCVQDKGAVFAWTASISPIMAGLIAMIVQFFYAWRIWTLGGHWLKACSMAIAIIALMECLCAFIGSIKYDIIGVGLPTAATVPYFAIWLSGSFTCDVLIAGCMTIIFVDVKTRSHFEKTNTILNTLIRHVVETAAITAFSAGVELVLFIKSRDQNLGYATPAFVLGKLYSNCLLANLNNRKQLSYTGSSSNSEGSGNLIKSFRLRRLRQFCDKRQDSAIVDLTAIQVDQTRHVQHDGREGSVETSREDDKQFGQEGINCLKGRPGDEFAFQANLKTAVV